MDEHDQVVRAGLSSDGTLWHGYHPRMAAVHDANAAGLQAIVREHGWPTEALVGADGARAAHRIAQHAINHPDLMREWRDLLDRASANGEVPRLQFAFLDDRVHAFEGRPQRYGTQWRDTPGGPEPYPLEDPSRVDEWRSELGLPSLAEVRATMPEPRPWDPSAERAKEEAELAWRRSVGWIL
jgi:hypothetical protein